MDIDAIRQELNLTPTEFQRALGVSSGHAADLRSGRRKVSLKVAARLEELTNRTGIVSEVTARMIGAS